MVGIGKSLRELGRLAGFPLEFETMQRAVLFFDIVNLLLLGGAPEIHFHIPARIHVMLHALAQNEIFPQRASVGP